MHKTWLVLLAVIGFASCDNSTAPPRPPPEATGPTIQALPFKIETVMFSDLFINNLKVSKVNVQVQGGSPDELVATALAVAYTVGDLGANSIEATVDRSDLDDLRGKAAPLFFHLAKVFYSPDPAHTVWSGDAQLMISITEQPATREEVERDTEFDALEEKFIDKGMENNAAEDKAGAIIAKKYHLPKDWRLYSGGLADGKYPGTNFNVDSSRAADSLAALDACMHGKIIRMLQPCD